MDVKRPFGKKERKKEREKERKREREREMLLFIEVDLIRES